MLTAAKPSRSWRGLSNLSEKLMFAAGVALVVPNRWFLRLGLRRRVDGWRRGAGLVLRRESATFVLSAFGLDLRSDIDPSSDKPIDDRAHVAARLAAFLGGCTVFHRRVRRTASADYAEPCAGPTYTLGFEPWVDGPARFVRPETWDGTDCSPPPPPDQTDCTFDPLLNIVCRVHPADGVVDVWMRANHVGIDGVPVQEALSELESAWGCRQTVVYPTPEEFAPYSTPRRCPSRTELAEAQTFMDFTPLLAWRKRQNDALAQTMTVSAALTWCLARHPAFTNRFIASAVEVPPARGIGRGVSMLVIRPSDYFQRPEGLAQFVHDFNRQLYLIRGRRSSTLKILDAAALMPARLELALLRLAMSRGGKDFGSLGLTILKHASVFGTPCADAGHPDGFMAIGNVCLPATDGRRVGSVTIKAPAEKITDYAENLRQAIEACAQGACDP
jgi:hypothetical protein